MTTTTAPAGPSLCSLDWDESGLPAWGTAKDARVIVAVESAGSWGRDAVKEASLSAPKGITLYVIREPGRHARTPEQRRVFVSGGFGSEPWIVEGLLTETELFEFLRSDVVDADTHRRFGFVPRATPVVLICTNGRRDACCAVRGRPVAAAAAAAAPGVAWEVSHIGGHKLAPTAIHLPSGQTFGRLTEDDAVALATADLSDALPPALVSRAKHRGRVDLAPAERVAETWWREAHPALPLTPPVQVATTEKTSDGVLVELPDGQHLLVTTHRGPVLRESCAKGAKPSSSFAVRFECRSVMTGAVSE